MTAFGEKVRIVSSGQCINSQVRYRKGAKQEIQVRLAHSRALFATDLVPSNYLLFPDLKKLSTIENAICNQLQFCTIYYKQDMENTK